MRELTPASLGGRLAMASGGKGFHQHLSLWPDSNSFVPELAYLVGRGRLRCGCETGSRSVCPRAAFWAAAVSSACQASA